MPFSDRDKAIFDRIAACVRALTLEAIEKASSGHPGMPLGCAEIGTLLFTELLQHSPTDTQWLNRDRFVLSSGHGSMLLYSLLHLCGYAIDIEDIKQFRCADAKCPGHPEFGVTPGVETTTGPLGQGLATAVGMAIAQKKEQARWGIFNNRIVVIAGDGDMMEGVVHEAVSLAGMQQLNNLIVIYDSNRFTIDGSTDITFTENVAMTFEACGWKTLRCNGYDYDEIASVYTEAKRSIDKPVLIIADTIIGKGAPSVADNAKAHAGAVGQADIDYIRKSAGLPSNAFSIPQDIYEFYAQKRQEWENNSNLWMAMHEGIVKQLRSQHIVYDQNLVQDMIDAIPIGSAIESRTSFSEFFQKLQLANSFFIGGTADLNVPCLKAMTTFNMFTPDNRHGNFISYGVREHGMAAISNGIKLYQPENIVYAATFLTFVDYLRPALRLSALMELPVIYILAYDSIYIGEDGPTHQPIEQLPSLRCMPNLAVIRPADAQEGVVCAKMAVERKGGPVACVTTRQKLKCFEKFDLNWQENMSRNGAYIVKKETKTLAYTIVATGSEVFSVLCALEKLEDNGSIRVVSMPCREYFYARDMHERNEIVPVDRKVIVVEASADQGWSGLSNQKVTFIGIDSFGFSAPGDIVARAKGMDAGSIARRIAILDFDNHVS
jgi:transketolase